MGKMSVLKGKLGEREVAKLLRDHGFDQARRGQQYAGGGDSPDVVGLPGYHIEVKRTEAFNLYAALGQSEIEAGLGETPVVFHRRSCEPWVVVLEAKYFLDLVKQSQMNEWAK
jgi:Holliday junction resolvase